MNSKVIGELEELGKYARDGSEGSEVPPIGLIRDISHYLETLEHFQKLKKRDDYFKLLLQSAECLHLQVYKRGDLLCRQFDRGDKFYIILSGEVNVYVCQSKQAMTKLQAISNKIAQLELDGLVNAVTLEQIARLEKEAKEIEGISQEDRELLNIRSPFARHDGKRFDVKRVNQISANKTFGEFSLAKIGKRTASILCRSETTVTAWMTYENYHKIFDSLIRQKEILANKITSIFPAIGDTYASQLSYFLVEATLSRSQVLYKEGDVMGDLFFLDEGSVELRKLITVPQSQKSDTNSSTAADPQNGGTKIDRGISILSGQQLFGFEQIDKKRFFTCISNNGGTRVFRITQNHLNQLHEYDFTVQVNRFSNASIRRFNQRLQTQFFFQAPLLTAATVSTAAATTTTAMSNTTAATSTQIISALKLPNEIPEAVTAAAASPTKKDISSMSKLFDLSFNPEKIAQIKQRIVLKNSKFLQPIEMNHSPSKLKSQLSLCTIKSSPIIEDDYQVPCLPSPQLSSKLSQQQQQQQQQKHPNQHPFLSRKSMSFMENSFKGVGMQNIDTNSIELQQLSLNTEDNQRTRASSSMNIFMDSSMSNNSNSGMIARPSQRINPFKFSEYNASSAAYFQSLEQALVKQKEKMPLLPLRRISMDTSSNGIKTTTLERSNSVTNDQLLSSQIPNLNSNLFNEDPNKTSEISVLSSPVLRGFRSEDVEGRFSPQMKAIVEEDNNDHMGGDYQLAGDGNDGKNVEKGVTGSTPIHRRKKFYSLKLIKSDFSSKFQSTSIYSSAGAATATTQQPQEYQNSSELSLVHSASIIKEGGITDLKRERQNSSYIPPLNIGSFKQISPFNSARNIFDRLIPSVEQPLIGTPQSLRNKDISQSVSPSNLVRQQQQQQTSTKKFQIKLNFAKKYPSSHSSESTIDSNFALQQQQQLLQSPAKGLYRYQEEFSNALLSGDSNAIALLSQHDQSTSAAGEGSLDKHTEARLSLESQQSSSDGTGIFEVMRSSASKSNFETLKKQNGGISLKNIVKIKNLNGGVGGTPSPRKHLVQTSSPAPIQFNRTSQFFRSTSDKMISSAAADFQSARGPTTATVKNASSKQIMMMNLQQKKIGLPMNLSIKNLEPQHDHNAVNNFLAAKIVLQKSPPPQKIPITTSSSFFQLNSQR